MINSIRKQVDIVRIHCNDYKPSSEQINQFDNVQWYWGQDYTDRGKFRFVREGEYHCLLDDDLLLPNDYVRKTKEFLEKNAWVIATYHGRILKGEGLRYYQDHELFHFRNIEQEQKVLDVPGTGVTAFNTNYIKPTVIEREENLMADLLLGLEAAQNDWPIVGLPHGKDIGILKSAEKSSIYRSQSTDADRQNEIADEIYRLNH